MKGRCSEADLWLNLFFFFGGGSVCVKWQALSQRLGGLRRRVSTNKSEAVIRTSSCSQHLRLSPLGNLSINQERKTCRGIDGCQCVEGGGSLQLIKASPEELPPSPVKDLGGVGPHTSACEHLPLILEEVGD